MWVLQETIIKKKKSTKATGVWEAAAGQWYTRHFQKTRCSQSYDHLCRIDLCHLHMWNTNIQQSKIKLPLQNIQKAHGRNWKQLLLRDLIRHHLKCRERAVQKLKATWQFYWTSVVRGKGWGCPGASLMSFRTWTRAPPAPHTVGRWDIRSCACHTLCTWPCARTPKERSRWASPCRSCTGSPPRPSQIQCLHAKKETRNHGTWINQYEEIRLSDGRNTKNAIGTRDRKLHHLSSVKSIKHRRRYFDDCWRPNSSFSQNTMT